MATSCSQRLRHVWFATVQSGLPVPAGGPLLELLPQLLTDRSSDRFGMDTPARSAYPASGDSRGRGSSVATIHGFVTSVLWGIAVTIALYEAGALLIR
jgi:hypothetical protein